MRNSQQVYTCRHRIHSLQYLYNTDEANQQKYKSQILIYLPLRHGTTHHNDIYLKSEYGQMEIILQLITYPSGGAYFDLGFGPRMTRTGRLNSHDFYDKISYYWWRTVSQEHMKQTFKAALSLCSKVWCLICFPVLYQKRKQVRKIGRASCRERVLMSV